MEIISLKNPYPNGVLEDDKDLLQPFFELINEVRDKIHNGERVYLEITSGERKGSIAYVHKIDPSYKDHTPKYHLNTMFRDRKVYMPYYLNVILGWDKRRNKIKWSTYHYTNYLKGYKGPTVWKKFDKKKAEKELLKNQPVVDRDGNILKEGDRVLYINARYGSGATLDRGTIIKIKYSVQKTEYRDNTFNITHVIIKNDDGSESDIKKPELSILKIKESGLIRI